MLVRWLNNTSSLIKSRSQNKMYSILLCTAIILHNVLINTDNIQVKPYICIQYLVIVYYERSSQYALNCFQKKLFIKCTQRQKKYQQMFIVSQCVINNREKVTEIKQKKAEIQSRHTKKRTHTIPWYVFEI